MGSGSSDGASNKIFRFLLDVTGLLELYGTSFRRVKSLPLVAKDRAIFT